MAPSFNRWCYDEFCPCPASAALASRIYLTYTLPPLPVRKTTLSAWVNINDLIFYKPHISPCRRRPQLLSLSTHRPFHLPFASGTVSQTGTPFALSTEFTPHMVFSPVVPRRLIRICEADECKRE